MNLKDQEKFARENGYARLGFKEVDVESALTTAEKVDLGKAVAESLVNIEDLNGDLAKIKAEFKNKIDANSIVVAQGSIMLKSGLKTEKKKLPCFFDPRSNLRIFLDENTGQIITKTEGQPEDRQLKMVE